MQQQEFLNHILSQYCYNDQEGFFQDAPFKQQ